MRNSYSNIVNAHRTPKEIMYMIKQQLLEQFLKTPFLRRYSIKWYKKLGVHFEGVLPRIRPFTLVGDWHYLYLHSGCDINEGCMFVAKDKIEIGEGTAVAYNVSIYTSAYPHGNKLTKLYPKKIQPVVIGKHCWIGANAVILPGVEIGDYCVVAAGSVVTKNVPSGVMVAGSPAVIKKKLEIQ